MTWIWNVLRTARRGVSPRRAIKYDMSGSSALLKAQGYSLSYTCPSRPDNRWKEPRACEKSIKMKSMHKKPVADIDLHEARARWFAILLSEFDSV